MLHHANPSKLSVSHFSNLEDETPILTFLPAVAQVQADICQLPDRSRKPDLYAPLSIEILAFICVLLRLYSRWYTTNGWEYDDYVMAVVAVSNPYLIHNPLSS